MLRKIAKCEKWQRKKGMNKEEKERIVWFRRQRRERQNEIYKKKKRKKWASDVEVENKEEREGKRKNVGERVRERESNIKKKERNKQVMSKKISATEEWNKMQEVLKVFETIEEKQIK